MSAKTPERPNEVPKERSMLLQKEMIGDHYQALAEAASSIELFFLSRYSRLGLNSGHTQWTHCFHCDGLP